MRDPHETAVADDISDGSPPSPVDPKEGGEQGKSFDADEASAEVSDTLVEDHDNGKSKATPPPQAQPDPSPSRQESMETVSVFGQEGDSEDLRPTSLVDQITKQLADGERAALQNNGNDGDPALDRPSALHRDEYSQHDDQHRPYRHESALEGVRSMTGWERQSSSDARPRKTKGKRGGKTDGRLQGGAKHSNPRKSPFRSEVARIRHAQRLERQGQGSHSHGASASPADDGSHTTSGSGGRTISLTQTTAPPPTSSFAIQSARFKHSVLNSLGEFLTSAFADDEESSGSYFSQDLLDQLAASDPRLRGVWLQAKSLNDDHVRQLCDALVTNKVVTEVWLPSNSITDVGAAHLAYMLKFNKTIRELFLGGNDIGPRGAAALAGALARGNSTLVALGLGDNHIGVEGAGALAAALRHNHSLHTLDVKGNGIPRKSSVRRLLSKMIEFNASDPGDESLVLGLQDELASFVSRLDPKEAEAVVLQAEQALTAAMACRKRGDKVGAAEAEGAFIRICTTGAPPVDPPEREGSNGSVAARSEKGRTQSESRAVAARDRGHGNLDRGRDAPEGNDVARNSKAGDPPQQKDETEQEDKGESVPGEEEGAKDMPRFPAESEEAEPEEAEPEENNRVGIREAGDSSPPHQDEAEQEKDGRDNAGEEATAEDVSGMNDLGRPKGNGEGMLQEEGVSKCKEESKESNSSAVGGRGTSEEGEEETADKPAAADTEALQEEEEREEEVR